MKNRFVEESAIDSGTALAVMRRSLRFVWPFRGRMTVKLCLLLVGSCASESLHAMVAKTMSGETRPLADFVAGKPVLMVNVASR